MTVQTKWHRFLDAIKAGNLRVLVSQDRALRPEKVPGFDVGKVHELLADAKGTPHFVIAPSIYDLVNEEGTQASFNAMTEAGVFRLPYPCMWVEFEPNEDKPVGGARACHFVILLERERDVNGQVPQLFKEEDGEHPIAGVMFTLLTKDNVDYALVGPGIALIAHRSFIPDENGPGTHYVLVPSTAMPRSGKVCEEIIEGTKQELAQVCGFAMYASVAMSAVRGIVKEDAPAPVALNKKRSSKGKTPIPDTTIVKIGHYLTREGKQISYDERRSPRLHLRRGHTRTQHYGKGREQIKTIFIEATLVNYKPEGDQSLGHSYVVRT